MKVKKTGKFLMFIGAAAVLAASLINDKKSNSDTEEEKEEKDEKDSL